MTERFEVYFVEAQEKLIYPHCLRLLDEAGAQLFVFAISTGFSNS